MKEENERIAKQESFVLTRDMIPIDIDNFKRNGVHFTCPLPKGFKVALEKKCPDIKEIGREIVDQINTEAKRVIPPFENIFLGYHGRTDEQKKDLLKQFKIEEISVDYRGVYGVQAGFDVNSGDIHLSSHDFHSFICGLSALDHIFEPSASWQCHNVDFYWQALLTREFCVRYFNYLNGLVFGKKFSRQKKLLAV